MRRVLAFLLLISMFILPLTLACVPSGYEEENPNRPPSMQSPSADELQEGGATVDEGAGDEGATTDGGEDSGDLPENQDTGDE